MTFTLSEGDFLIFLCSLVFTVHILSADKFTSGLDPILLSFTQYLTACVLGLIGMILFENWDNSSLYAARWALLYAGICSTGIAYTLQIIGQSLSTDPAIASLCMSMESPFCALGGWLIQNQILGFGEILGCLLMFAALILAQFTDRKEST